MESGSGSDETGDDETVKRLDRLEQDDGRDSQVKGLGGMKLEVCSGFNGVQPLEASFFWDFVGLCLTFHTGLYSVQPLGILIFRGFVGLKPEFRGGFYTVQPLEAPFFCRRCSMMISGLSSTAASAWAVENDMELYMSATVAAAARRAEEELFHGW